MNRGNMGKQISSAPKSKKVKKMFGGGMASMPTPMPGSAVRPPMPGSAVRPMPVKPMPVKPMPGGVRGTSGPKPAPMRMAKGGKIDGCCMKGKTKGKMC